jgi:hypothetical protein
VQELPDRSGAACAVRSVIALCEQCLYRARGSRGTPKEIDMIQVRRITEHDSHVSCAQLLFTFG